MAEPHVEPTDARLREYLTQIAAQPAPEDFERRLCMIARPGHTPKFMVRFTALAAGVAAAAVLMATLGTATYLHSRPTAHPGGQSVGKPAGGPQAPAVSRPTSLTRNPEGMASPYPASGPQSRPNPALAEDPETNHMVLYGGGDNQNGSGLHTGYKFDNWEWDGRAWSLMPGPAPQLVDPVLGADSGGHQLVLVGKVMDVDTHPAPGKSATTGTTETWVRHAQRWQRVGPTGLAPTTSLFLVPGRGATHLELFAVGTGTVQVAEWNGSAWTSQRKVPALPVPILQVLSGGDGATYALTNDAGQVAMWQWNNDAFHEADRLSGHGSVAFYRAGVDSGERQIVMDIDDRTESLPDVGSLRLGPTIPGFHGGEGDAVPLVIADNPFHRQAVALFPGDPIPGLRDSLSMKVWMWKQGGWTLGN